jgi:hypothetical protein
LSLLSLTVFLSSCAKNQNGAEGTKLNILNPNGLQADKFGDDYKLPSQDAIDKEANEKNSISGNWKLVQFNTVRREPEVQFLRDLYQQKNRITFQVTDHPRSSNVGGTGVLRFKVSSGHLNTPCTVTLVYDFKYCCPDMRLLTFSYRSGAAKESTLGCSQKAFGQDLASFSQSLAHSFRTLGSPANNAENHPEFHFNFYIYHLNIKGSWDTAKDSSMDQSLLTELKLVPTQ